MQMIKSLKNLVSIFLKALIYWYSFVRFIDFILSNHFCLFSYFRCNVSNWNAGCKPYETKRCNVIKHQIFTRCIKKLGKKKVEEYLKSCQIEACFYHKSRKFYKTNLCFTIESFAGVCAQAGFNVDWRKVSKCRKKLMFLFIKVWYCYMAYQRL